MIDGDDVQTLLWQRVVSAETAALLSYPINSAMVNWHLTAAKGGSF